jgi:hypothetical protein
VVEQVTVNHSIKRYITQVRKSFTNLITGLFMILSKIISIIEKAKILLKIKNTDSTDPVKAIETRLIALSDECRARFSSATNEQDLRIIRAEILGKNGELTSVLRAMSTVPPKHKREMGEKINNARADVENAFESRLNEIRSI